MRLTKQFELTLVWRKGDSFEPKQIDKVEGDDLVELLSQFLMVIALVQRKLEEEIPDDDIPF